MDIDQQHDPLALIVLSKTSSCSYELPRSANRTRPNSGGRHGDLKDQDLVVEAIPTLIGILQLAATHVPVLSNEIVVTETEDELFTIRLGISIFACWARRIDRSHSDRFPFLVQEPRILVTSIVHTKSFELGVNLIVKPRAIGNRCDTGSQHAAQ